MTKDEAMKQAMEAITQYLAESPDPSEEAVENLCDARAVLGKTLAQPAQKRPQNCGTGYCSCIECVMEPAQQGTGVAMEEAWKLALEALIRSRKAVSGDLDLAGCAYGSNDPDGHRYDDAKEALRTLDKAITALREAPTEQPAQQEPAPGYCKHCKQYTIEESLPAQRTWVGLTADNLKEPKNGEQWRVEWWNESCRMMLPADMKLDRSVVWKNGTVQFTIKKSAHGIKENT